MGSVHRVLEEYSKYHSSRSVGWQVLTHDPSNKQAEAELTKARKRVLDERGFAPAEKPRRKMVRRGALKGYS